LRREIRHALTSYATTYISVAIQFATSIMVARILTPEEIGISSVSYAFIALANIFRDLGIASYIYTNKDLTNQAFQTCLGLSMAIGGALFLLTITASLVAAQFHFDTRVINCLLILSFNFLLIPPQAIVSALFVRHGQQNKIFISTVSAGLIYFIVALLLAKNGASYMTTPLSSVLTACVGIFVAYMLRHRDYKIKPMLRDSKGIIRVSVHPFINGLARTGSERAPELAIVGAGHGYSQVAFFEKGATAVELARRLTFDSVNQLFVPRFRQAVSAEKSLVSLNTEYFSMAFVLGVPACAILWACALPLIQLLFGDAWITSVPILKALSLSIPALFLIQATSQSAYFTNRHSEFTALIVGLRIFEIFVIGATALRDAALVPWAVVAGEYLIAISLLCRFSALFNVRFFIFRFAQTALINLICFVSVSELSGTFSFIRSEPLLSIILIFISYILIWSPITAIMMFRREIGRFWSARASRP